MRKESPRTKILFDIILEGQAHAYDLEILRIQNAIRRLVWLRRIGQWAKPNYCGSCTLYKCCRRMRCNERIIMQVLRGDGCYDYTSVFSKI